jgi:aspartate-semialdehyde dehydrogenase
MRPDVPLVVPEVNAEALKRHEGIVANPNCSTAQLVLALKPLHDAARITRILVATYQAVSGAGGAAVEEMKDQNTALSEGRAVTQPGPAFPVQVAANVIPQIGGFDDRGYTSEEMKLVHETRKIMGDDAIRITPMVTARVPVFVGHSEAVYVETERPITPAEARALWRDAPGLAVLDEIGGDDPYRAYPTPLFAAGKDTTFVGRIRQDLDNPNGLNFWVVSDNLRKGAATNAVQIAESLVEQNLLRKNNYGR